MLVNILKKGLPKLGKSAWRGIKNQGNIKKQDHATT